MCRYAAPYKPHYACFNCRKTFKRRLLGDIRVLYNKGDQEIAAKCPECAGLMANMGLDFESPKMKDVKAWSHIAMLYKVGVTFHSCGCSGPGYIPCNKDDLLKYFTRIKNAYIENQHFWARRKEDPESQGEIAKDKHENGRHFYSIPKELKKGTKNKPKYDSEKAQVFWAEKVAEVELKIKAILS